MEERKKYSDFRCPEEKTSHFFQRVLKRKRHAFYTMRRIDLSVNHGGPDAVNHHPGAVGQWRADFLKDRDKKN